MSCFNRGAERSVELVMVPSCSGSMGLLYPYHPCVVYLPTFGWLLFMVNVGEYTIHGCYGLYLN